jgi:hypothetical protein
VYSGESRGSGGQTDRQTDRKNRKGTIAIAQIDSTDKQTDKITIVGALSQ